MKSFRLQNQVSAWLAFLIAFITYYLTVEPTASWWDCGEFITAAAKLQVGHPPGAPLFMLIGRAFASLAPNTESVAFMVNMVSVLASAFTIFFLFLSITHLARKMVGWNKEYSLGDRITILGSGLIGALVFTFSDSFWFSAVEGEVYALSSLFTAVVFWAILKWEAEANQPHNLRWIILIAYLMGLSIGVHLLNLLAIPAIVFIYYFKKYTPNPKGVVFTFILSVVLVLILMYGIIPGIPTLASWFELFFINLIGLPYNSGVIIFIILIVGFTVYGLIYTRKKGKVLWNTVLVAFTMIVIGYSSYTTILIRSNTDTPMEQNNPDEVFRLLKYLNRDQYGDRPLLYGQYYTAPLVAVDYKNPTYTRINGKYEVTDRTQDPKFDKRFMTLFPRMWHNSAQHAQSYQQWADIKGRTINVNRNGEVVPTVKPTFVENLRFFFSYQVGHMYFRYFMWNFVGRQDDIQSHGGVLNGNWMSGIKFIDEARLGPQDIIPDKAKNHKSRNFYYFLPLLLGLIGAFHQYKKGNKDFWVIMLLFVYTGLAIVVYLNQWPNQPRERDYAFAGSYYAFAIWVGLGVLGAISAISKVGKVGSGDGPARRPALRGAIVLVLLGVPTLMAFENWDDHDRSGRYMAREYARNYLNSCAPNAILFTNGDNDTFPLWYAQEVEGIRTDVRVICLPYLAADWYIEQMTRKVYDSDPVPFSLTKEQYRMGTRDLIPYSKMVEGRQDLKAVIEFIKSDNQGAKRQLMDRSWTNVLPTTQVRIPVDSAKVVRNGTVQANDAHLIVPVLEWDLPARSLSKTDLMILDLIAQNDWNRPIYFTSIMHGNINGLQDYFQLDGLAYRFVPIKNQMSTTRQPHVNTDLLYERFMNQFEWGGTDNPDLWIDYYTQRTTLILRLRYHYTLLADRLLAESKPEQAIEVLDRVVEILPPVNFPYEIFAGGIIESYYRAGAIEKGNEFLKPYMESLFQDLSYYLALRGRIGGALERDAQDALTLISQLLRLTQQFGQIEIAADIEARIQKLLGQ